MKSKSVAKINAIITFPMSVKIHFVCFTVTGSFLITIQFICLGSLLDSAREIQTLKQMNGNQKWPSYCETYEMNFHRRWKGDGGIYFGYRFWFHRLYEQNGLFLEAFSRQWRFWNMISMIFVVLYDILHYCNLPYERSETESLRFENNMTSSHTSQCRLAVQSATRRVDLEICFSQLYPNGNKIL